jgi:hypothetical protein
LGGAVRANGAGQTIAIVTAYDQPNIVNDLLTFNIATCLPNAPFTKVAPYGINGSDQGWGLEASLDVEWAHAFAPGASIVLVEAASGSGADLLNAVDYARNLPGVSVVSMSYGGPEFAGENYYDGYFTTPTGHQVAGRAGGVTFVASSGDSGAAQGPNWPSTSPNVLSVGGTTIGLDGNANIAWEAGWSGSGGGASAYYPVPSYQVGSIPWNVRGTPDVSADSNPATGVIVYDSYGYNGQSGWFQLGGTSAGAPMWAGILAVANQGRALNGLPSLDGAQAALYQAPASAFRDITQGINGYLAGWGWDPVTGRGTPYADRIDYFLSRYGANPSTPSQPTSPGSGTTSGGTSGGTSGSGGTTTGGRRGAGSAAFFETAPADLAAAQTSGPLAAVLAGMLAQGSPLTSGPSDRFFTTTAPTAPGPFAPPSTPTDGPSTGQRGMLLLPAGVTAGPAKDAGDGDDLADAGSTSADTFDVRQPA